MLFGRSGPGLLVLHERHSPLVLMARAPSKAAGPIAETIARVLGPLPPALRQTITFDNGTEFARHHELHDLGIKTFFCDTYAPWQKGGVENAIGRAASLPAPEDEPSGGAGGAVYGSGAGVQQYAA